jgi:hypothetical protein
MNSHLSMRKWFLGIPSFRSNKKHKMAQISVVISDEEFKILTELARETGRSNSSLAGEWIRKGMYDEISNQNKVEVWRSMLDKRRNKETQQSTQEEKSDV